MTRVHALLAHAKLMSAVSRPDSGWSPTDDSNQEASRIAFRFEREHPDVRVESCEAYSVGRHTSVPLAVGGVWFDCLLFDRHDQLLGYHRRFVDWVRRRMMSCEHMRRRTRPFAMATLLLATGGCAMGGVMASQVTAHLAAQDSE